MAAGSSTEVGDLGLEVELEVESGLALQVCLDLSFKGTVYRNYIIHPRAW